MENFKEWIKAAGIRAIKTVAQTAIATIGTTALIDEINWPVVASTAAVAGILSLLTSIAGLPEIKAKKAAICASESEELTENSKAEKGVE